MASFYYWPKKLGPDAARPRPTAPPGAFRAVSVVPAVERVSIQLACGTRIEVRAEVLDQRVPVDPELAAHAPLATFLYLDQTSNLCPLLHIRKHL